MLAGRGEKAIIDESGNRETVRFSDPGRLLSVVKADDWNEYHVVVRGNHLKALVNGQLMSEVIDSDKKDFHPRGRLAFQLHSGQSTEVKFKNILIKRDSKTPKRPTGAP
jgi:hypothetical protein